MRNLIFISLLFVSALSFSQLKPGIVASSGGEAAVTNMITNGTFDADTDWSYDSEWSIGSGVASYDDTGSGDIWQVDGDMVSSIGTETDYTITFDIVSTGTAAIRFGDTSGNSTWILQDNYGNGSHEVSFTTPVNLNSGGLMLDVSGSGTTATFTIDNIIVTAD